MRLRHDRIRQRRVQLGITQRELASALNEVQNFIRSLELGHNRHELTIRDINRVATALAVDPSWLLDDDDEGELTPHDPHIDVRFARLISLAGTAFGRGVPLSVLSQLLDIPLTEMKALLKAADRALTPLGLTLMADLREDTVRLATRPELVEDGEMQIVLRSTMGQRQPDVGHAKLIYQALCGTGTAKTVQASHHGRLRLGWLINAGLVESPRNEQRPLEVTSVVRESLLLDEVPLPRLQPN